MPLKVLFVTDVDLAGGSGSNVATRSMLRALVGREDLEVTLLSPAPGGKAAGGSSDPTVGLDPARWDLLQERVPRSPRWHLEVALEARERCRRLLEEVDPDVVVVRYAPFFLLASRLFPVKGTDLVVLVRGTPSMGGEGLFRTLMASLSRWIGQRVLERASRRLFAFREAAEAFGFGEEESDFEIVPNAADPERIPAMSREEARQGLRARGGPDLQGPVVAFVGSIRRRHRLEELLRASSALREEGVAHQLLIVGDGPLIPRLRELAGQLSIEETVVFVGQVPHREVGLYLCASDLMYCVVDPERPSNPIKVYEALAAGRPVVTTATPELAFVAARDLGVLVDRGTGDVADGLRRGLALPWDDGRAAAARSHIARHHTWEAVAEAIVPKKIDGSRSRPTAHADGADTVGLSEP